MIPRSPKKLENTIRKVRRRNKLRRHNKRNNTTISSNNANKLVKDSSTVSSGKESFSFQNVDPEHFVTLEDLHKNHFNLSGKNGKLVKRKIRVKKLPTHLKGTTPTFVKLRYPEDAFVSFDNSSNFGNNPGYNRTTGDKRCKLPNLKKKT